MRHGKSGKRGEACQRQPFKSYIRSDVLITDIEKPLDLLQVAGAFDVVARVRGGA